MTRKILSDSEELLVADLEVGVWQSVWESWDFAGFVCCQ